MWAHVIIIGLLLAVLLQRQTKLSTLKRIEAKMSTQEEKLQAIAASLPAIAAGIDTLQAQVAELKEGNPDLNDEIAAIETTLATIAADLNPPAPEPEPEPTPEP